MLPSQPISLDTNQFWSTAGDIDPSSCRMIMVLMSLLPMSKPTRMKNCDGTVTTRGVTKSSAVIVAGVN